MKQAGFWIGGLFLLLGCASVPPSIPGKSPFDPPLYHTTAWGALQGTLVADSPQALQELATPLLGKLGSLFVVYSFREYTMEPGILLVITGPTEVQKQENRIESARAPVQLFCKARGTSVPERMNPERLSRPELYIPGCLTYVTTIGDSGVELRGSPNDFSLGDEYLLFLSPLESNVLTQENTLRCRVTDNQTLHRIQCQFMPNDEGYIPYHRPYHHARAVFLRHNTFSQTVLSTSSGENEPTPFAQ